MSISHHINQALKAHGTMKNDVDYVVKDGEVIIVDEFTGRLMYGRRYSDGFTRLRPREGVKVERKQTLATITFQNYFRMYKKLAGRPVQLLPRSRNSGQFIVLIFQLNKPAIIR